MYLNDKHEQMFSGRPSEEGSRFFPPLNDKQAPRAFFEGVYRRSGFKIERVSDGLTLIVCPNPRRRGPRDADRFFVCVSEAGRVRVGFLYGPPDLDGCEFNDVGCKAHPGPYFRYRIERLPDEQFRIRVKHPMHGGQR